MIYTSSQSVVRHRKSIDRVTAKLFMIDDAQDERTERRCHVFVEQPVCIPRTL